MKILHSFLGFYSSEITLTAVLNYFDKLESILFDRDTRKTNTGKTGKAEN